SVAVGDGFTVHPRLVKRHIQPRLKQLAEGAGVDWSTAEALALGSLLREGYNIRLCGQDVGRGTFSQRHAMLVCQDTENVCVPLNNSSGSEGQGNIEVVNSNLSELAVLGFEYGVSIQSPGTLPIWEAQFGDFNNTAQVIIDTYIASGETKWLLQSGLVMLLPHGYDGAGPEHSSSRMERFLQLCNTPMDVSRGAQNPNMHVAAPTTPAQIFHLLRRQMTRPYRKPLVVAGPKTILRLAAATSPLADMGPGTSFQPVLGDVSAAASPDSVRRVVLVAGKLYYDLALARSKLDPAAAARVALVRVEELCPFPASELRDELARFPNATEVVWCQEETMNAGAFSFVQPRLQSIIPGTLPLRYVGRGPLAAPVTGVSSVYKAEQAEILRCALADA
ncbi:hypothetical protein H4R19_005511, partial [Coemansia spiralis]